MRKVGSKMGVFKTREDIEAQNQLHYGVLSEEEYESFLYHQQKFGKSHSALALLASPTA